MKVAGLTFTFQKYRRIFTNIIFSKAFWSLIWMEKFVFFYSRHIILFQPYHENSNGRFNLVCNRANQMKSLKHRNPFLRLILENYVLLNDNWLLLEWFESNYYLSEEETLKHLFAHDNFASHWSNLFYLSLQQGRTVDSFWSLILHSPFLLGPFTNLTFLLPTRAFLVKINFSSS